MTDSPVTSIHQHVAALTDPRLDRTKHHHLLDIVMPRQLREFIQAPELSERIGAEILIAQDQMWLLTGQD